MKKFKEFRLRVPSDKRALFDCVVDVAYELGYMWNGHKKKITNKLSFKNYRYGSIVFDEDGCLTQGNVGDKCMSFDEFFALTPEDVVIEPDTQHCDFNVPDEGLFSEELTQDQIDRIKAIMGESDE